MFTLTNVAQEIAMIVIGVASILLMSRTEVMRSDFGRLLVVSIVALALANFPLFDCLYAIDKLLVLAIGIPAMFVMVNLALSTPKYQVLSGIYPMLLDAGRSAYEFTCEFTRMTRMGATA